MSSFTERASFVAEILSNKNPIIKNLLSRVEHLYGKPASEVLTNYYIRNDNFVNDPLDMINKNTNNGEKNMKKNENQNEDLNTRLTKIESKFKNHVDFTNKHFENVLGALKDIAELLENHEKDIEKFSKNVSVKSNEDKIQKEKLYICWDGEKRSEMTVMICHDSTIGEETFKDCNGDDSGYPYDHFDEIPKKYYTYSSDKPQTGKIYFVWDERKDDGAVMFCQGRFDGEFKFCGSRCDINEPDYGETYKHVEFIRPELIGKVSK